LAEHRFYYPYFKCIFFIKKEKAVQKTKSYYLKAKGLWRYIRLKRVFALVREESFEQEENNG